MTLTHNISPQPRLRAIPRSTGVATGEQRCLATPASVGQAISLCVFVLFLLQLPFASLTTCPPLLSLSVCLCSSVRLRLLLVLLGRVVLAKEGNGPQELAPATALALAQALARARAQRRR